MKNIKQSIIMLFSFNFLIITTSVNAVGPGYVSRDCPLGGAKESITLDWNKIPNWFQTYSMHAFPVNGDNSRISWIQHRSDPKPGARGGWDETWHSYAGSNRRWNVNDFYSRVVGYHYWFNLNTRRIETRTTDVQNCNLSVWGLGNWSDDPDRINWIGWKPAYRLLLNWW